MLLLSQCFGNAQQSNRTGHIVVRTLGQGSGVIVGGKDDVLAVLTGDVQNHIVGITGVFLLLQGDGSRLGTALYQFNGILGVDVHTQHLVALMDEFPQFPLINIPVCVVSIAVIGDKTDSAIFQQILIFPVTQVTVEHYDLALALLETVRIIITQIINRGFHSAGTGTEISLTGNFLTIYGQRGRLDGGHGNGKGLQGGIVTQCFALCLQIQGAFELFRSAAGTDIGGFFDDFINDLNIHLRVFLSFDFSYCTISISGFLWI